jgi:hypothetical protein
MKQLTKNLLVIFIIVIVVGMADIAGTPYIITPLLAGVIGTICALFGIIKLDINQE